MTRSAIISRCPSSTLDHARFVYPDRNHFGSFPQNLELSYAVALALAGPTACSLIHRALGVLTALAAYGPGRVVFAPQAGLIAAALFQTTPLVAALSGTAHVDLGVTLCECLAVGLIWLATSGRARTPVHEDVVHR